MLRSIFISLVNEELVGLTGWRSAHIFGAVTVHASTDLWL